MTPDRAAMLRKLAEPESLLDGLVHLMRREWERFRERRDAASLLRFADAVHATRTQLAVLHTLLERLGPSAGGPALGAREPEETRLRQLESELVRTLAEAEELRSRPRPGAGGSGRAEGPPAAEPAEPTAVSAPGPRPGPVPPGAREAAVEKASGEAEGDNGSGPAGPPDFAAPNGPPGLDDDAAVERGQAVEAMLSRIHADWQHYRRSPSREQAGILEDEIRQALELVGSLAESVGPPRRSTRPAWVPEPSSVPFPPYRDQATGLFSRQGFDAVASGQLKKCRRHERPFALVLLELGVADLGTLRTAAAQVRRTLRESDLVGRHVERIVALGLSETGPEAAGAVASRVTRALESVGAWTGGSRLGVASFPRDGETLLGLLDTARERFSPDRPGRGRGAGTSGDGA